MEKIIRELSISVACLLDDVEGMGGADEYDIITKDIEHLQNLITKLENIEVDNDHVETVDVDEENDNENQIRS